MRTILRLMFVVAVAAAGWWAWHFTTAGRTFAAMISERAAPAEPPAAAPAPATAAAAPTPLAPDHTPEAGTQGSPVPIASAGPQSADVSTAAADGAAPGTAVDASGDHSLLRLQVLLDRAHFSPGQIDGKDGDNTRRAVQAFAAGHGAEGKTPPRGSEPAAGVPDKKPAAGKEPTKTEDASWVPAAVWAALAADRAPALVEHELAAEDLGGPYVKVPEDMMEKAKLEKLGYESALEALGERYHASPALLQSLNPGARFSAGETIKVPNVHTSAPSAKVARVVVDNSTLSVRALDASGGLIAYYPATMGSQHDPLPIGEWKVTAVQRDPPFHYNPDLFWDAEPGHAKAKIAPGPNNPVGVVWIDLSKEHYGIHGTPEPSTVGKTQSHGCIRLTNWDAAELAGLVGAGTPAVLQR